MKLEFCAPTELSLGGPTLSGFIHLIIRHSCIAMEYGPFMDDLPIFTIFI